MRTTSINWRDPLENEDPMLASEALLAISSTCTKPRESEVATANAELRRYCAELEAENQRLRTTLARNLVDYADEELLLENNRLQQQVQHLHHKLQRKQQLAIVAAKIVDSRLSYSDGRQFVEYRIEIKTNKRGTLYAWHRYRTFRALAQSLRAMKECKKHDIPELPRQLFGRASPRCIEHRVKMLNDFLDAALQADHLHWGIRVDEDTCVYKRRIKKLTQSMDP